jgi:hypothetical protein
MEKNRLVRFGLATLIGAGAGIANFKLNHPYDPSNEVVTYSDGTIAEDDWFREEGYKLSRMEKDKKRTIESLSEGVALAVTLWGAGELVTYFCRRKK